MSDLKEWTINFVKHKDIFSKRLIDFKIEKDVIEFNFKDKKHFYVIMPFLDNNTIRHIKNEFVTIVCLNKKKNLNFLKANWNVFIKFNKLNFVFVNLNVNEKWSINPSVHEKISDKESFSEGLNSMFESVQEVR